MSLVSLDWMMRKAEGYGLRFLPEVRALYRALQNVDDKLYDARAGFGIFYRWKPRDIQQLCRQHHLRPTLHMSAIERIVHSTEGYAPGNIPPDCDIVETSGGNSAPAKSRAVQSVLRTSHATRVGGADLPLLNELSIALKLGLAAYYLFLVTVVAGLVMADLQVAKVVGYDIRLWLGVLAGLLGGGILCVLDRCALQPRMLGFLARGAAGLEKSALSL